MVRIRERAGTAGAAASGWVAAGVFAAAFLVLTAAVARGVPDALDRRVLAWARPHDAWDSGQVRWAVVVEALRPPLAATALAVVAIAVCLVRRSPRPGLRVAAAAAAGVTVTLLVKVALARPDPHATGSGHGGSFPSGHTLGVVVCVGLALQLVRPGAGRWAWAAGGLAGTVMGVGLVVIGAHWVTDVVGGLLLGMAVVSAAATGKRVDAPTAGDPLGRERVTGRRVP